MRRTLLVLALLVGVSLQAATVVTYESITVANTSIGLTSTTLQPAGQLPVLACSGRVETAQIRFRYDGTAPTSSEGVILEVGDIWDANAQDAATVRFIRTGAVSGVVKVHCWR